MAICMLSSGVQNTCAAIVVGHDKAHAIVGELDRIVMAKDLKAARIGKDGTVPVHEVMEPAQLINQVLARAHAQVIGVGKHDLRAQCLNRLGGNALDVGLGSHGHKDGRLDIAVRRVQNARTRMRLGILGDDVVFEEGLIHVLELLVDMHVRAVVSHTKTAREQNPRRLHSVSGCKAAGGETPGPPYSPTPKARRQASRSARANRHRAHPGR